MNFKLCRISGRLSTAEGSILCTVSNKKRVISIDYHQNSHVIKGAELYTTIRQDIKILSEQTADMDLEQYRNTALAPLLDKIEQNKKTDKDGQDYKDNKLAGLTPTRHSWTKAGQTLFPEQMTDDRRLTTKDGRQMTEDRKRWTAKTGWVDECPS